jgi:hypothetical protein
MKSPYDGIETEVKDVRLRPVLVFEHSHSLSRNDFGYRVIGVFEVRQPSSAERATLNAGWLQTFGNPVVAEIAFVGDLVHRVEEPHAVGASHDAVATANAPFPIYEDHAVVRLVRCADWAYLDAGRVITLIAKLWNKKCLCNIFRINFLSPNVATREAVSPTIGRIRVSLTILGHYIAFNPGPCDRCVIRNFIFVLACVDAQSAADTLVRIDKKRPPDFCFGYRCLGFVCG